MPLGFLLACPRRLPRAQLTCNSPEPLCFPLLTLRTRPSSAQVRPTIETLLKHVEPWQVYLADNGSTEAEIVKTARLCADLSAAYRAANPSYSHPGDINCGRCACLG